MIKTLIVEDNKKSAELLKSYISNLFNDLEFIGIANNLDEAVNFIFQERPSLVFLDINLQEESGFDVLKKTNAEEYEIIITTAYSEYTLQAIKNSAIDYILKPYDIEELKNAVNKARKQIELKRLPQNPQIIQTDKLDDRVFISTTEGLIFIKIDEIVCISADSSYSVFHLVNGSKVVSSKRLSIYEEMLKNRLFVRVHKSYLINLKHVKKYQRGRGGYLCMTNGLVIKVGDSKKDEILKYLVL
ncbi:MAG: response regulator transcription factor [Bacteroidales bacterium]|nr:response regulator transcription factor [Bacteroidales bacterium]